MAKFYGSLDGGGKPVTRCGKSGRIEAHIRGWNHGIRIHVSANPIVLIGPRGGRKYSDDGVIVTIDVTGGSNDHRSRSQITIDDAIMEALSNGTARLEVVPVISDVYSSDERADPATDSPVRVHRFFQKGTTSLEAWDITREK